MQKSGFLKIQGFYICQFDESIDLDSEVDAQTSDIDMKLKDTIVIFSLCLLKSAQSVEPINTFKGITNLNTSLSKSNLIPNFLQPSNDV